MNYGDFHRQNSISLFSRMDASHARNLLPILRERPGQHQADHLKISGIANLFYMDFWLKLLLGYGSYSWNFLCSWEIRVFCLFRIKFTYLSLFLSFLATIHLSIQSFGQSIVDSLPGAFTDTAYMVQNFFRHATSPGFPVI